MHALITNTKCMLNKYRTFSLPYEQYPCHQYVSTHTNATRVGLIQWVLQPRVALISTLQ